MSKKTPQRRKGEPAEKSSGTHLSRWRTRSVLWVFLIAFVGISVRLVEIHMSPEWDHAAEDIYHIGEVSIQMPRGRIFDRDGRILATDRQAASLSADPSRIADPEAAALTVSARLGLPEDEVYEKLTRRRDNGRPMRFVWIKRFLSEEERQALGDVEAIDPEGLRIEAEPVRHYPGQALGAHVLGFVNRERVGSGGVELTFDKYLRSTPGRRVAWKDRNRILLPSLTLDYQAPEGGADLQLTLDAAIQHSLEKALEKAVVDNKAKSAMGVLMDPHTGAILALACYPSYDPNVYMDAPPELLKNRAVYDVFEPGSVFKIVTAAAAIETGLISADSPIDCEGGVFYPRRGRRITDTHELDVVPFHHAFAESSNIAMVKLAAHLGDEELHHWIRRFGFGQPTSSQFRGESAGLVWHHSRWSRDSNISLSIGNEIAVTLLQVARAFCAVANGGLLVEPYVVERAVSPEGVEVYRYERPAPQRILRENTAEQLKYICHQVVADGTGTRANIPAYRTGGKTGTPQVVREDGRGYYQNRYNAVFAGFSPLRDPQICGAIFVTEPGVRMYYGGSVCAPVYREVASEALVLMHAPEDPVEGEVVLASSRESDAVAAAAPAAEAARLAAEDEDLAAMNMNAEDLLASLDGLELVSLEADSTGDGEKLPDFRGMTKLQAKEAVQSLGLQWSAPGSGWVVYQQPPPGTPLHAVSVCRLVFSNDRSALKENEEDPQA